MNKKVSLTVCFFLVAFACFSQDKNTCLTIYSNGYLEKVEYLQQIGKKYHVKGLCPSISYSNEYKDLIFQFDLMPIFFATYDFVEYVDIDNEKLISSGSEQKQVESSIGLITKYRIFNNNICSFNVVCDNRMFYQYNSYNGYLSSNFPWTDKRIGWTILLGFEFEKRITDLFSISLMPLYTLNDYYYYDKFTENPIISNDLKSKSEFRNNFNPIRWNLKIGLKIKIKNASQQA